MYTIVFTSLYTFATLRVAIAKWKRKTRILTSVRSTTTACSSIIDHSYDPPAGSLSQFAYSNLISFDIVLSLISHFTVLQNRVRKGRTRRKIFHNWTANANTDLTRILKKHSAHTRNCLPESKHHSQRL